MRGRLVPFDPKAKCDYCGAIGAYDFMGDFYCINCAQSAVDFDDENEEIINTDNDIVDD